MSNDIIQGYVQGKGVTPEEVDNFLSTTFTGEELTAFMLTLVKFIHDIFSEDLNSLEKKVQGSESPSKPLKDAS